MRTIGAFPTDSIVMFKQYTSNVLEAEKNIAISNVNLMWLEIKVLMANCENMPDNATVLDTQGACRAPKIIWTLI